MIDPTIISIDRAGRVVIPKEIREAAGIEPGMALVVTCAEGRIEIAPRRGDAPRAAWAERAAHCDDFDDDDEPCSARRRATAQGGSRATAIHLSA